MKRIRPSNPLNDPGTAKISAIAMHWNVCEPTARKILRAHGVPAQPGKPEKYRWEDIWRLEGFSHVPEWDWLRHKAPLLKTEDLVDDTRRGRSARSLRRKLEIGRIPSIRLGPDVRRIRPEVADRLDGYL
jgi:hypothetical protein